MRNVILFAISLTLALVAAAIAAEAQSDIDLFQGTWKFTKTVEDGAGAPPPPDAAAIGFESNKMLDVQGANRTEMATFKLDPSKKPKEIDVTYTTGPDKGNTFKGAGGIVSVGRARLGAGPASDRHYVRPHSSHEASEGTFRASP